MKYKSSISDFRGIAYYSHNSCKNTRYQTRIPYLVQPHTTVLQLGTSERAQMERRQGEPASTASLTLQRSLVQVHEVTVAQVGCVGL